MMLKIGGDLFFVYAWVFMSAFSIIMVTIIPAVIMPIFNKFESIPDGTLKRRIFSLAKRLDYPLTNLFVMDGKEKNNVMLSAM